MTLRRLLSIASRAGRPGTLLNVGDSGGRRLYLELVMEPVSIVAALDAVDVEQLHTTLAEWLRERDDVENPRPFPMPTGSPLVGGILGRVVADAGRARTVQVRTVHTADQHVPARTPTFPGGGG